MKKILTLTILMLVILTLMGCSKLGETQEREETTEDLVQFLTNQMYIEREDLEYGENETDFYYSGASNLVMGEKDDGIFVILFEDHEIFTLQFALDDGKPFEIHVLWFDFSYVNIEEKTAAYIEFYPADDERTAIIEERFEVFIEKLALLGIKELKEILEGVGYDIEDLQPNKQASPY
jgi:uncharacterized lipoprotein NlpE involved in copper resistance